MLRTSPRKNIQTACSPKLQYTKTNDFMIKQGVTFEKQLNRPHTMINRIGNPHPKRFQIYKLNEAMSRVPRKPGVNFDKMLNRDTNQFIIPMTPQITTPNTEVNKECTLYISLVYPQ